MIFCMVEIYSIKTEIIMNNLSELDITNTTITFDQVDSNHLYDRKR